jgi:lipoate-protein ligase A
VSFLQSLELYNDGVPRSAAMNMAIDEVLWQTATGPQLRLYQWDRPALSFGYFGRYADVAQYADEHELVRRCTGGGIVFHGSDLTYALIIPSGPHVHESSPIAIYTAVHEAIQDALRAAGIVATLVGRDTCRADAGLSPPSHPPTRSYGAASRDGLQSRDANAIEQDVKNSCFANPVTADVLVHDQKVAGAAQRRSRRGLLQQGSIQNVRLSERFREHFTHALCASPVECDIPSACQNQAEQLAETKYATTTWLRRR